MKVEQLEYVSVGEFFLLNDGVSSGKYVAVLAQVDKFKVALICLDRVSTGGANRWQHPVEVDRITTIRDRKIIENIFFGLEDVERIDPKQLFVADIYKETFAEDEEKVYV